MSTLKQTIENSRPNPLGSEVQGVANETGGNISAIADELGLMNCPKEDLPPALRKAREALEESARLKQEAETGVRQGMQDWRAYEAAHVALTGLRSDLASGEAAVKELRGLVDSLPNTFEAGWAEALRFGRFGTTLATIGKAQEAREALKLFPTVLERLRVRIAVAAGAIATMEKEHGFNLAAPDVKRSPEAQPEEHYEEPASAFRISQ